MLTFSVNKTIDMDTKAKQLAELIKSMNKYNEEYVADAYFSLIDRDAFLDLNNYARTCKKNYFDKQNKSKVSNIISYEDVENGYKGVVAEELVDDFDYIDECETWIDFENKAEDFGKIRSYIWYCSGIDIYRLLELTVKGDKQASIYFKRWVDTYALQDYFNDLLVDIRMLGVLRKKYGQET